jgi:hypothetical protein
MEDYVLGVLLLVGFALNVVAVALMGSAFRQIVLSAGWRATIQPDHDSWNPVRERMRYGAGLGLVAAILYYIVLAIAEQLPG